MSKKGKSKLRAQARLDKTLQTVQPVFVPLCEMFAICDDVFTEENAFDQAHIQQSLGRIYRQWKETRQALDPEFNPANYEKRKRRAVEDSPIARALNGSSTETSSTSGKSRKKSRPSEKPKRKQSATRIARSSTRVSRGR